MASAFFNYLKKKPIKGIFVSGFGKKKWQFDTGTRITFKVSGNFIKKNGVNWLKKTGNTFTFMDPGGEVPGITVTGWSAATKTVTFSKAIKRDKNAALAASRKERNAEVAANKVKRI